MKKISRRELRSLINESLQGTLVESSSSKILELEKKLDQALESFQSHIEEMGGIDRAYAHGYLSYIQEEIAELEAEIKLLKSNLPATDQLDLPFEKPELSDYEKRLKAIEDNEAFEKAMGYDPSKGYT